MLKFGFIMRKIWIFDWRFLCRLSHKLKILLCYTVATERERKPLKQNKGCDLPPSAKRRKELL